MDGADAELVSEVTVQGVAGSLSLGGLFVNMTAVEQCAALRQSAEDRLKMF